MTHTIMNEIGIHFTLRRKDADFGVCASFFALCIASYLALNSLVFGDDGGAYTPTDDLWCALLAVDG